MGVGSARLLADTKHFMIDTLSIVLSHSLLAIMLWRLLHRPDLDDETQMPDDMMINGEEAQAPQSTNRFGQNSPSQQGFRNRA